MRNVIVHYHMFKNAGTTVDAILRRHFPKSWAAFDLDNAGAYIDQHTLINFIDSNPSAQCISSHQARPPAPNRTTLSIYPVLFLRHPIDRIYSIYHYLKRLPDTPSERPAVTMAKTSSLADFLQWRLKEEHGAVIRNFQTVFLSGSTRQIGLATATVEDFEKARYLISSLQFFGLVECFEASIKRMGNFLSPIFGEIDLTFTPLNSKPARKSQLEGRLSDFEAEIGQELFQRLLEENQYDIELHSFAKKVFIERHQLEAHQ